MMDPEANEAIKILAKWFNIWKKLFDVEPLPWPLEDGDVNRYIKQLLAMRNDR